MSRKKASLCRQYVARLCCSLTMYRLWLFFKILSKVGCFVARLFEEVINVFTLNRSRKALGGSGWALEKSPRGPLVNTEHGV